MKTAFILLMFISFSCFSQDTIFLKNGTKIFPDPTLHKYYGTKQIYLVDGKKVEYFLPNSSWGKSVKSKDLDYAVVGKRLIKTFEFKYYEKGKLKFSKPLAYYVLIETEKYRLITCTFSSNLIVPIVYNYVVNKNDEIIEGRHYVAGSTKKDEKDREEVVEMIKKYFSNIEEEMEFLEYCKAVNKNEKTGIQAYLNDHLYKKYN